MALLLVLMITITFKASVASVNVTEDFEKCALLISNDTEVDEQCCLTGSCIRYGTFWFTDCNGKKFLCLKKPKFFLLGNFH